MLPRFAVFVLTSITSPDATLTNIPLVIAVVPAVANRVLDVYELTPPLNIENVAVAEPVLHTTVAASILPAIGTTNLVVTPLVAEVSVSPLAP